VQKFIHAGLLVCIYTAVLSFGGTEPVPWAGVQFVAFSLFGILIWTEQSDDFSQRIPWKGPIALAIYLVARSSPPGGPTLIAPWTILNPLTYICAFYLARYASRTNRSRDRFVLGFIILALIEAFYGLLQYLANWQYIFTYPKKFYTTQATGTYINPNHYAGFLEMILPLAFVLALYQLERLGRTNPTLSRRANLGFQSERVAPLIFFSFASLLIFGAILFSRSRMGIFSATTAVASIGGLWVTSARRRGWAITALVGFLAIAVLFGIWIGLGPVAERYEALATDYHLRMNLWKDTLSLIRAHPLFGSGFGTYATVYTTVQTTALLNLVDHAHNDYLEITVELGIIGAGLLFGLILSVLARGISAFYRLRQTREGFLVLGSCGSILAILFHSLADFNLQIPANALVFAAILGLSYSISANKTLM
jgi:O-antigen ligase